MSYLQRLRKYLKIFRFSCLLMKNLTIQFMYVVKAKIFEISFLVKKSNKVCKSCNKMLHFSKKILHFSSIFQSQKVIKNIPSDVKPRRIFFEIQMSFKTSFEWSFLKDFQITTFLDLMFNVSPPVGWLEFL